MTLIYNIFETNFSRVESRTHFEERISFWIKRGYDLEWLEKRFLYHIRVFYTISAILQRDKGFSLSCCIKSPKFILSAIHFECSSIDETVSADIFL